MMCIKLSIFFIKYYIMELKSEIVIVCPHCSESILIYELNCCIFRHGIYKDSGKQIDPHLNKEECTKLFDQQLIYGCGKPFKIIKMANSEEYSVEICDYI